MILADLVQTNPRVEEDDDDLMDDVGAKDDDASGESGSESDENESDDSDKREKRKEKEALKIKVDADTPLSEKDLEVLRGAGILARSSSTAGPSGQQGSRNGHIVFVDDEDSGRRHWTSANSRLCSPMIDSLELPASKGRFLVEKKTCGSGRRSRSRLGMDNSCG